MSKYPQRQKNIRIKVWPFYLLIPMITCSFPINSTTNYTEIEQALQPWLESLFSGSSRNYDTFLCLIICFYRYIQCWMLIFAGVYWLLNRLKTVLQSIEGTISKLDLFIHFDVLFCTKDYVYNFEPEILHT